MTPADRSAKNAVRVFGVDGCRGGWIVCARPVDGTARTIEWSLLRAINELDEARRGRVRRSRVAIDMPIGLLAGEDGPDSQSVSRSARACDREARRALGRRACTLFTPPTRRVLGERKFRSGLGVSLQSFHLFPKLRELDAWMTKAKPSRVHEAHPELAFARLRGGRPIEAPKRTLAGRTERLAVLRRRLGRGIDAQVARALDHWPRSVVAADDVVDAAVLSVTAEAIERDEARRFPPGTSVERDDFGLRMEIWS